MKAIFPLLIVSITLFFCACLGKKKVPDSFYQGMVSELGDLDRLPCMKKCATITDNVERQRCSDERVNDFIFGRLEYPAEAVKKNVEGIVILSFIVETDGNTTNERILHDIGGGCGEAALQVVEAFPEWEPGLLKGNPTRTRFVLPVNFSLK